METSHEIPTTSCSSSTGRASVLYSDDGGSSPLSSSKQCPTCREPITKRANKFCDQSCAAKYNNQKYPKRSKTIKGKCVGCGDALFKGTKYCTLKCQQDHRHKSYIDRWLAGEINGLTTIGTASEHIKRWLRETRGNACELCGWHEVNPFTGKVPVVADHIDGHWENNRPENLKLVCPNCDSLQSTYKAANKGNGRPWRRQ